MVILTEKWRQKRTSGERHAPLEPAMSSKVEPANAGRGGAPQSVATQQFALETAAQALAVLAAMVLAGREQAAVETIAVLIARHIRPIGRHGTFLAALESLAAQLEHAHAERHS
jgi:uncharacterized protein (DUF1810 family)